MIHSLTMFFQIKNLPYTLVKVTIKKNFDFQKSKTKNVFNQSAVSHLLRKVYTLMNEQHFFLVVFF